MTFDLSSLGWDASFSVAYARFDRLDARPGRVTRVDRGVCTVLTANGTHRASLGGGLLTSAAHDPVALPCAGDWVVVRGWPDGRTTVELVLPRRTAIVRASAGKESSGQVLAANLTTAAVVEPVDPQPDLGRIERLLALAFQSGAEPVVLLTKVDLARDPAAIVAEVERIAPEVPVWGVAAEAGRGLDPLRPLVGYGQTMGLLGASGAGKSTLVNALAGATVMGTQAIRRVDGRGRHTTTYRALVPVPNGGAILDTPGLRGVGLIEGVGGLEKTFADIDALTRRCRFPDCSHQAEPGCAVRAALATGELGRRRYASWRKLQAELAREMQRHDARLSAEERSRWRRIQKHQRVRGAGS